MNRLNKDFTFKRYGIETRLVNEADAAFIVKLRTDPSLAKFLHATDNDVEKQKEWIRNYKKREKNGLDYYFIHSFNGEDFSVNRIYDITEVQGTSGSWICKPGTEADKMVASMLIERDILFELLDMSLDHFDVRRGNKKVWKFHQQMGASIVGEDELNFYLDLQREVYFEKRKKFIKLLGF